MSGMEEALEAALRPGPERNDAEAGDEAEADDDCISGSTGASSSFCGWSSTD
jgi:hypothetical protein